MGRSPGLPSLLIAVGLAACVHPPPPPEPADDLSSFRAPLLIGGELALRVEGSVQGKRAEVLLDLTSPLTLVSSACFASRPPSRGAVRVPRASGGFFSVPEITLHGARLGSSRLGPLRAGMRDDPRCVLALGSDALEPYAVHLDPERRELSLSPSRTKAQYVEDLTATATPGPDELHLVDLARDPGGDWLLLPATAQQHGARLTGTFILATSLGRSSLAGAAARRAGLKSESELLREAGAGETGRLLPSLGESYALDELQLLPGVALKRARFGLEKDWSNPGATGYLHPDVWGKFHATVDARAGLLVLRRPRVLASGNLQRCARGANGNPSEEGCYALHAAKRASGLAVVGTLWRDLPEGGRLYLETVGGPGTSGGRECRVGFSFDPSDRGISAAHQLPWSGLERSLPACARELSLVEGVTPALFEEGPLPECPGVCAFVVHLPSRHTSCECHLSSQGAMTGMEQRLRQLLRLIHEKAREKPKPTRPQGPASPEPEPDL